MSKLAPLREVVAAYGLHNPEASFAICYGSTVRSASETSDFDMLIVERTASPDAWRAEFADRLVALHHTTGRQIDQEVPYENKLFYALGEVQASLSHEMFWSADESAAFSIPTFEGAQDNDPYFASPAMKQRLCLNALTSAHSFLGGNRVLYRGVQRAATVSLGYLASQIVGEKIAATSFDETCEFLAASGDARYKDFLGYTPEDGDFRRMLRDGLTDLRDQADRGLPILGPNGHCFLRNRVRDLLAGLFDDAQDGN